MGKSLKEGQGTSTSHDNRKDLTWKYGIEVKGPWNGKPYVYI